MTTEEIIKTMNENEERIPGYYSTVLKGEAQDEINRMKDLLKRAAPFISEIVRTTGDSGAAELENEIIAEFPHVHYASPVNIDTCRICGRDIREDIHVSFEDADFN